MNTRRIYPLSSPLSARQRFVRYRASRLPFKAAVRLAADALFRFTHCASASKALWSERTHVWLGRKTFFCWAMEDTEIDIPRMVADTVDAPESSDELCRAVHAALTDYWTDRLDRLPAKSTPRWLPLP
ncbi:MAG: hypothetical protein JXB62_15405 [Pirellulales bacterium]|nr:hypothetical protein [Pirellulales bacterium]